MSRTDHDGAATNLPPGYPDVPDSRGRARKSYNGKLLDFGKHGTPESIEKYKHSPLPQAFLDAAPAATLPLGYPKNADSHGQATKVFEGKHYHFGKHGTQGSVDRFNRSHIAQAYLSVIGEKTGPNEWIDPDGARYRMACDIPLASRTLKKHRLDVATVPKLDLDEAAFRTVIEAAGKSAVSFRGLDGNTRSMLYQTARGWGFRASELAALCPKDFNLATAAPAVRVSGKRAIQPLPVSVVNELRIFLGGRPADSPVWPGTWHKRAADMVRIDLDAAGITYVFAKKVPIHDGFDQDCRCWDRLPGQRHPDFAGREFCRSSANYCEQRQWRRRRY
jgi:hypothetical protein